MPDTTITSADGRSRSLVVFAFLVMLLNACSDERSRRSSGSPDANVVAAGQACGSLAQDAAALAAGEPVSFESLMPIFGLSCNSNSCHLGTGGGTFPRFGPECAYDADTGDCLFEPGALSAEVLDSVYAELRAPSTKVPALSRVEPGDALRSFLVLKISDCHESVPELTGCTDCGTEMPPGYSLRVSSPDRYQLIVRWVAQGAPR